MSDPGALGTPVSRPAEALPVSPTPQAGERQTQGQPNAGPPLQAGQIAQPTAPPFKEPAISLSPHLAGIKVGDILAGTVERIDAQVRAVVQNARQTILVDPAAHLKPTQQAQITVTQTSPQFLGSVPAPKGAAPIPVQLALVALRGLDVPTAQAPQPQLPGPVSPIPSPAPPLNAAEDVASTLSAAPKAVAPSKAPAPTAPVLLQAQIALAPKAAPPSPAVQVFAARHPTLSPTPSPILLTVLPASPSAFAISAPPAPKSPIGQLIAHGRAVVAQVQPVPGQTDVSAKITQPTLTVRAGPLEIKLPNLPDVPLRAGDRLVLVSASAAPDPAAQDDLAPIARPTQSVRPTVNPKPVEQLQVPTLPPILSALPKAVPSTPLGRVSQLLAYSFFETPDAQPHAKAAVPIKTPVTPEDKAKQAAVMQQAVQQSAGLRKLMEALEPLKRELAQIAPAALGAATVLEAPALPLIIAGPDAPLLASVFHLTGHGKAHESDDDSQARPDQESDERTFEVAIEFKRFGKTQLSGRLSRTDLFISLRSEHPLPRGLREELSTVFKDRCQSCGLKGGLTFRAFHPGVQSA